MRERKGGRESEGKGRETLPSYVHFHVVALPSGRGHALRAAEMSCLRLNGSPLASDSITGIIF